MYLNTDTIVISLAVDQNILKLQLYTKFGLKVHTLSFNLRVFSSQFDERLRKKLFNMYLFFQGTMHS